MPDATQMLREDHKKVKRLFRDFEKAQKRDDERGKSTIVDTVLAELEVHTKLEEEIFYPALRKRRGTDDMMEEAEEEHHVVDVLAEEIKQLAPSNPDYEAKFTVLLENVEHHIKEEEDEMLPRAKALGKEALTRLGARMAARKRQLVSGMPASEPTPRLRSTANRHGRSSGANRVPSPGPVLEQAATGARAAAQGPQGLPPALPLATAGMAGRPAGLERRRLGPGPQAACGRTPRE